MRPTGFDCGGMTEASCIQPQR